MHCRSELIGVPPIIQRSFRNDRSLAIPTPCHLDRGVAPIRRREAQQTTGNAVKSFVGGFAHCGIGHDFTLALKPVIASMPTQIVPERPAARKPRHHGALLRLSKPTHSLLHGNPGHWLGHQQALTAKHFLPVFPRSPAHSNEFRQRSLQSRWIMKLLMHRQIIDEQVHFTPIPRSSSYPCRTDRRTRPASDLCRRCRPRRGFAPEAVPYPPCVAERNAAQRSP